MNIEAYSRCLEGGQVVPRSTKLTPLSEYKAKYANPGIDEDVQSWKAEPFSRSHPSQSTRPRTAVRWPDQKHRTDYSENFNEKELAPRSPRNTPDNFRLSRPATHSGSRPVNHHGTRSAYQSDTQSYTSKRGSDSDSVLSEFSTESLPTTIRFAQTVDTGPDELKTEYQAEYVTPHLDPPPSAIILPNLIKDLSYMQDELDDNEIISQSHKIHNEESSVLASTCPRARSIVRTRGLRSTTKGLTTYSGEPLNLGNADTTYRHDYIDPVTRPSALPFLYSSTF